VPEWVKGSLIVACLAIYTIAGLLSGKVTTPYGTYSRTEKPEIFFATVGLVSFLIVAVIFITLAEYGLVPNFTGR
jgi:hypothetical protein